MIKEKLFQDNIIPTIFRNLEHYLSYKDWLVDFLIIISVLYLCYLYLKRSQVSCYPAMFPQNKYTFNKNNKLNWLCLFICTVSICIFSISLFNLDDTIFASFDLMSKNTTKVFQEGVTPLYNADIPDRFAPLAFWEMNILYAISHNYHILNIFIIAQVIMIAVLLYIFFDFITVNKRLIYIATCIISPSFFFINNWIFAERDIIMLILISFIFLKKFSITKSYRYIWYYILFMNFAIYTKENIILFYFGILAYMLLYKISLKDFLHPIQSIKKMPIEFLMFISMLSYALLHLFIVNNITNNLYLEKRLFETFTILNFYKLEIFICLIGLYFLIKNKPNYLINDAILFGCISTILFQIFIFKLMPIADLFYRTYYMVVPFIFGLGYTIENLKNNKVLYLLLAFIISYSVAYNHKYIPKEQGKYYHEIANFIDDNLLSEEPINLFISENSEEYVLLVATWSSAYKYYFPNHKITFKNPFSQYNDEDKQLALKIYQTRKNILHNMVIEETPIKGDFYIVKKTDKLQNDLNIISQIKHQKIYENQLFYIFEIK